MKNVTMADIAERCGLSKATVSRALTSPEKVSEATLSKIRAAMHETGYEYNSLAASMSKQSLKLIGVMTGSLREPLYLQSIASIQNIAENTGFNVMLSVSDFNPEKEQNILQSFRSYRSAGIIILGTSLNCAEKFILPLKDKLPHLILWENYKSPEIESIGFPPEKMMEMAVSHLAGLGHTKIGLALMQDLQVHRPMDRYSAFIYALGRRGIDFTPEHVQFLSMYRKNPSAITAGKSVMQRFLNMKDRPSAIIFPTGSLAFGGLLQLQSAGMKCPEDMSIISLTDDDMTANVHPSITAFSTPHSEIQKCIRQFFQALNNHSAFTLNSRELPVQLISRESCCRFQ